MSIWVNASSIHVPKDTVGWALGIWLGGDRVSWAGCTGVRVRTTRSFDLEARDVGQWVGAGGSRP